jgi:hypothetical protein
VRFHSCDMLWPSGGCRAWNSIGVWLLYTRTTAKWGSWWGNVSKCVKYSMLKSPSKWNLTTSHSVPGPVAADAEVWMGSWGMSNPTVRKVRMFQGSILASPGGKIKGRRLGTTYLLCLAPAYNTIRSNFISMYILKAIQLLYESILWFLFATFCIGWRWRHLRRQTQVPTWRRSFRKSWIMQHCTKFWVAFVTRSCYNWM